MHMIDIMYIDGYMYIYIYIYIHDNLQVSLNDREYSTSLREHISKHISKYH